METLLGEWYGGERGKAEMIRYTPEPVPLSDAVGHVASRVLPPWEWKLARAKESWENIAGKETARRCRIARLNEGVLYVEVFHPAYRIALDTPKIKNELLEKIQAVLGKTDCREIKFIAGGGAPR
ncbi:MAG: hypothetical protein BWY31_01121 [Lentisphaerae bacterium ADurb.Bin242]|nr:MAG: hypothetical protein BWY31_01121 [Lentisphaerae bacterium ADurb.Bin242]